MKKFLVTILVALIIGAGLGVYSYTKFKEEDILPVAKSEKDVYAFQVGVFDNYTNAEQLASKYGGIVILDNNKYRVYLAIVSNTLNLIKKYYDEKGIAYYIRNIEVNNDFFNELTDYEAVLSATNKDNYDEIIKNILKEYERLNL